MNRFLCRISAVYIESVVSFLPQILASSETGVLYPTGYHHDHQEILVASKAHLPLQHIRIIANCFISTHQERLPTQFIWFWFNEERPELMPSKNFLAEMPFRPIDPMLQHNNGGVFQHLALFGLQLVNPILLSHPFFTMPGESRVCTIQSTKQES